MRRLVVYPLPKNMGPGESEGRRAARARALLLQHQNDEGAVYVDVAKVKNKDAYVAAAVAATTGKIVTSCSVRTRSASQAEEMAIALAARSPGVRTILSDSKTAIRSFSRGACHFTNGIKSECALGCVCSSLRHGLTVPPHHTGNGTCVRSS
ncbi:hypothetical protein MRX96_040872 [Rhipicephalus microplus]